MKVKWRQNKAQGGMELETPTESKPFTPAKTPTGISAGLAAVFSLAVQGVGILSQAQLFALSDTERSRLNTAFVVSNFIFSAAGSFLASALWNAGGWQYVALSAATASLLALAVHYGES